MSLFVSSVRAALLKAFLHTRRATAAHSPVWLGLHWAGCTTAPNEHAEPEWGVCASENSPTPKRKLLLLGFRVGLVFIGIQLLTKLTESLLSVLIRLCASGREMIHVRGCMLKFAMTFVCLHGVFACFYSKTRKIAKMKGFLHQCDRAELVPHDRKLLSCYSAWSLVLSVSVPLCGQEGTCGTPALGQTLIGWAGLGCLLPVSPGAGRESSHSCPMCRMLPPRGMWARSPLPPARPSLPAGTSGTLWCL